MPSQSLVTNLLIQLILESARRRNGAAVHTDQAQSIKIPEWTDRQDKEFREK